MSEIVGFVGMSHSPFATLLPPESADEPGGRFLADAARVRDAVARLAPDAVVVSGPDHFHGSFYDLMPPFAIGVEAATGFGDYGSTPGDLPIASDLAWHLHGAVTADGFDLALSYALTVDHGIVQSYEMTTGGFDVPVVPIVVNTAAPPLPSPSRCVALGAALGRALSSSTAADRVLVVASGGLSHWLPSNDPRDPEVDDTKRSTLINGRADVVAFSAAREPRVRAMAGDPDAPVNAEWDRWFLKQVSTGDLEPVVALGHDGIEEAAGSGGQEIRTWLVGATAVAEPLRWTGYEPVPEWITGMAVASTFPVD